MWRFLSARLCHRLTRAKAPARPVNFSSALCAKLESLPGVAFPRERPPIGGCSASSPSPLKGKDAAGHHIP